MGTEPRKGEGFGRNSFGVPPFPGPIDRSRYLENASGNGLILPPRNLRLCREIQPAPGVDGLARHSYSAGVRWRCSLIRWAAFGASQGSRRQPSGPERASKAAPGRSLGSGWRRVHGPKGPGAGSHWPGARCAGRPERGNGREGFTARSAAGAPEPREAAGDGRQPKGLQVAANTRRVGPARAGSLGKSPERAET